MLSINQSNPHVLTARQSHYYHRNLSRIPPRVGYIAVWAYCIDIYAEIIS